MLFILFCNDAISCLLFVFETCFQHATDSPTGTLKYHNMTTSYARIMNQHMMQMGYGMQGTMMGMQQQMMYGNANMYNQYGGGRRDAGSAYGSGGGGSTATVTLPIPDSLIGAIIGRGGVRMNEIMQATGARITISARGEYVPGTQNR